jgi:oxygen-dependent protoporphyrinogen oxidase
MSVAIIGAGISGLAAAYELHKLGTPFTLFERTPRLGGIIDTVALENFIIDCGPDSWITGKPWARTLIAELGLDSELISSNDSARRTYICSATNSLTPIPDGMVMMVPRNLDAVAASPLFSDSAKQAYAAEPSRAAELKAYALAHPEDCSITAFITRHFGDEVARTLAAPLFAGIVGGDASQLSAHAYLPALIRHEREHGSLILAAQLAHRNASPAAIFTSLRGGMSTLTDRIAATLPTNSIRLNHPVDSILRAGPYWQISTPTGTETFRALIIATPAHVAAQLLAPLDAELARLHAIQSSSAISVALAFDQKLTLPAGFGLLIPNDPAALLACTFVDQKFPHRAPPNSTLLRAFFGGPNVTPLLDPHTQEDDASLAARALARLSQILAPHSAAPNAPLPAPSHTIVRRLPQSLPLYAVGHLARVEQIFTRAAALPSLRLLGNAYRGVGLPDLIRDARSAAQSLAH